MSGVPGAPGRRILIVNPNTSGRITDLLVTEARRLAPAGVAVEGATAPFGAASLECAAELVIAAHAVLTVLAGATGYDAAIIGAFGDPGHDAASDLLPMPVVGMGRAGLRAASVGGRRRFAIVTVGPHMRAGIARAAGEAGVGGALVAIAVMSASVLDLANDPAAFRAEMAGYARRCVLDHGAEAVLFAGAPFSGVGRALSEGATVPLFDGLTCAMAEALAAPPVPNAPASAGGQRTPGKAMPGVPADLADLIRARLARP